jgi:hypothetical protein
VVTWPPQTSPEEQAKKLLRLGFKLGKLRRPWSTEEKMLLARGLQRVVSRDVVMHVQNKSAYYWLSHHAMSGRRSENECKWACKAILNSHPDWSGLVAEIGDLDAGSDVEASTDDEMLAEAAEDHDAMSNSDDDVIVGGAPSL